MGATLPAVLAGCAVALVAFSLFDVFFGEQRRVQRRLQGLSDYEAQSAAQAEPRLLPFSRRVLWPALGAASEALRALAPRRYLDQLTKQLECSGAQNPDAEALLAIKALAGVVTTGVALLIGAVGGDVARGILPAVALGAIAFLVPDLIVLERRRARQKAIRAALPDLLDMLTISVEAGLGFDAALAKLVQNSSGPLSEELARMLAEIQAGMNRADAFRRLSERTGVPEVATFASSIVQADVFGVSISGVLRTQARELRIRRRQKAEEQAQKAPVKMVFPLVLCILPVTLIVILGPAIISIARAFGLGG